LGQLSELFDFFDRRVDVRLRLPGGEIDVVATLDDESGALRVDALVRASLMLENVDVDDDDEHNIDDDDDDDDEEAVGGESVELARQMLVDQLTTLDVRATLVGATAASTTTLELGRRGVDVFFELAVVRALPLDSDAHIKAALRRLAGVNPAQCARSLRAVAWQAKADAQAIVDGILLLL
jgi:hypothetical protein